MTRPLMYPWDKLINVGDWVIVEGKTAAEISSSVNTYLVRRVGPGYKLLIGTIKLGAIVFLAQLPDEILAQDEVRNRNKAKYAGEPDTDFDGDPDEDIRQYLDD